MHFSLLPFRVKHFVGDSACLQQLPESSFVVHRNGLPFVLLWWLLRGADFGADRCADSSGLIVA